jgi:hypothetical protein
MTFQLQALLQKQSQGSVIFHNQNPHIFSQNIKSSHLLATRRHVTIVRRVITLVYA